MIFSTGRTCSNALASPPTRIESVAFRAPISPPVTGASNANDPFSLAICAIFRAIEGRLLVISTRNFGTLGALNVP